MDWNHIFELLRLDLLLGLCASVVLGGAVGLERELHGKPAGLRTNTLICVGACLFTYLSATMGGGAASDGGRMAGQVVSGVGFIGAGTILRVKGSVSGLTSASTIWVVAAIGMATGAGRIAEAVGSTVLLLLVLAVMGRVETYLQLRSDSSHVAVEVAADGSYLDRIHEIVAQSGATVERMQTEAKGDTLQVHLKMRGRKHSRDKAKLGVLRASGVGSMKDFG